MRTFRIDLRQFVLAVMVALAAGFSLSALAGSTAEISSFVGINAPVDMSIEELDSIKLGPEFPDISDTASYLMRGRKITVDVGGIYPIQSHRSGAVMTYVIQGEIVEHRSDQKEPVVRRAGDCAIDNNGIARWWENQTWEQVVLFIVDFIDPTKAGDH